MKHPLAFGARAGQPSAGSHGHWLRLGRLPAVALVAALLISGSAGIARANGPQGSGMFDPNDWWRSCFYCRQFMNNYPMQNYFPTQNYFPMMPQQYVALIPSYPMMQQYAPPSSTTVTISIAFPRPVVSQPAVAAVSAPPAPTPMSTPTPTPPPPAPQPTPAPRPQPAPQPPAVQQAPAANPAVQGPGS